MVCNLRVGAFTFRLIERRNLARLIVFCNHPHLEFVIVKQIQQHSNPVKPDFLY
ncbi:hypothetical protein Tsp_01663 [Trichinella spiralis]|uniref:hypothetical protein n=1 Tax=Trichinella spiralis TaxID=6334 RepID=UPI0001EFC685|nr:hypothetical protein Tsp_01663 [Trichinella spiralis]